MNNYKIDKKTLESIEERISEWKNEGKSVVFISLEDDPVDLICKVPGELDLKKAAKVNDDFDKNKQLVLDCVLYPELDVFNRILFEKPLIVTPISTELVRLSGITQKAIVKNL